MKRPTLLNLFNAPAWAATEERRIEFWIDLVESWEREAVCGGVDGWWSGNLGGCLEEVCGRLREGGWKEDDVREMMMMDGGDAKRSLSSLSSYSSSTTYHEDNNDTDKCLKNREGVVRHVRGLSDTLLSAGWSTEDVVDLLGFQNQDAAAAAAV